MEFWTENPDPQRRRQDYVAAGTAASPRVRLPEAPKDSMSAKMSAAFWIMQRPPISGH